MKIKSLIPTEEQDQIALVQWFKLTYPQYANCLHHSPNGGLRNKVVAGKLKAMGVSKGFPDLLLIASTRHYVGLAMELKRRGCRPSLATQEQRDWLVRFERAGFYTIVCPLYDYAREILDRYMKNVLERWEK